MLQPKKCVQTFKHAAQIKHHRGRTNVSQNVHTQWPKLICKYYIE